MLAFAIVLFISVIAVSASDDYAYPMFFQLGQCEDICSDSFFLSMNKESQAVCQRGCRFFNIIAIKQERNFKNTSKECHISCAESYPNKKTKGSCTIGCDAMSKKLNLQNILPFLKEPKVEDQELESLEADILLDPLIRKQVQVGYDLQYKIPEAYIRTMPINDDAMRIKDVTFRQWLCSAIGPFTVFCVILSAVMLCSVKIVHLVEKMDDKEAEGLIEVVEDKNDENLIDLSNDAKIVSDLAVKA